MTTWEHYATSTISFFFTLGFIQVRNLTSRKHKTDDNVLYNFHIVIGSVIFCIQAVKYLNTLKQRIIMDILKSTWIIFLINANIFYLKLENDISCLTCLSIFQKINQLIWKFYLSFIQNRFPKTLFYLSLSSNLKHHISRYVH